MNKYTYIKPKHKILKTRSKTPLENNKFQKAIKQVIFIDNIKRNYSTDNTEKINKKAKEKHEQINKEDNLFLSKKYPYMKKKL